ncbi:histone deacetylase complex subunit SAP25 [Ornithorhynchus anatinus]|uniref:histone deacetylase complex subunit SAP25 n=1 Tax=Ornithorhynchus anatinus TaxID=9258 RepID=UPI0010A7BC57|nr:histone deacetylase complex subunit SAP25 [Ornithorhynchus anatinus]
MLDPRSPLLLPPDRGALGSHGPRMDRGSHRPACGPAPPHHGPGGEGGIPVLSRHELFMSDPLLPPGQRIMLHVNQPPQPRGSLRLRTPPPIMACRVTPPPHCPPPNLAFRARAGGR